MKKKKWYSYLWIWSIAFFILGFFNILFAWLGMIDFILPLVIAIFKGDKWFCNNMCGRSKLLNKLGKDLKCSRKKKTPRFIASIYFRIAFLVFFLTMFGIMIYQTVLVAKNPEMLTHTIKLFWSIKIPFSFSYHDIGISPWIYKFSYGFYSLMLTSTLIGIIMMLIFKPRSWCSFCPMGTMTQGICKLKDSLKKVS